MQEADRSEGSGKAGMHKTWEETNLKYKSEIICISSPHSRNFIILLFFVFSFSVWRIPDAKGWPRVKNSSRQGLGFRV